MKLSAVVQRLEEAGCERVEGAVEFAGLKNAPPQLPAHFVVPEGEDAQPNDTSGIHRQRVAATFVVVVILSAASRREGKVSDKLDDAIAKVIDALVGWTPPGAASACNYVGGRMLSVDGHTLSWGVRFRTSWFIRKAVT